MKVLVTGGTGFVGSHSTAALRAGGHDVRLLVRSLDRVAPALDPLGISDLDVVEGDWTDPAWVGRALHGCDAVLHCANVFTWAAAQQRQLVRINTDATKHVLRQAVDRGLDPVVHVSSYVALLPSGEPLAPDSPIGSSDHGYTASKVAAERIARELQDVGAPVVTTYPGAVMGPHDPYLGDSNKLLVTLLRSRRPPAAGSIACVDVRDLAAVHAAVMAPGNGPQRHLVTGHDLPLAELVRRVASAAGRTADPRTLPPSVVRAAGHILDLVGRLPGPSPPSSSSAVGVLLGYPGSREPVPAGLGVALTPLEQTLRDAVEWLRDAGHLPDRPTVGAQEAQSPRKRRPAAPSLHGTAC